MSKASQVEEGGRTNVIQLHDGDTEHEPRRVPLITRSFLAKTAIVLAGFGAVGFGVVEYAYHRFEQRIDPIAQNIERASEDVHAIRKTAENPDGPVSDLDTATGALVEITGALDTLGISPADERTGTKPDSGTTTTTTTTVPPYGTFGLPPLIAQQPAPSGG